MRESARLLFIKNSSGKRSENEENCFSTDWQSKDVPFRWKAKPEFLCVVADFLHKDQILAKACLKEATLFPSALHVI